jgi:translation initiation factor 2 subunit 1
MVKASEYPDEGELVFGTVTKVKNFGAFVSLDEYVDAQGMAKEGFIHIAEVASGYVRYIRKVLSVKPSKGHVDLSLKQVNEHQRREKIQEWKNEKRAEKLFEIVVANAKLDKAKAYEEFGVDIVKKFGTMYAAFEESTVNEKILEEEGFKGSWVPVFVKVARDNIIAPTVRIKGLITATCPGKDGIDHIKEALKKAEKSEEEAVTVYYVGAPKYRIEVEALDYKTAENTLKKAVDKAIKHMKSKGGEASFEREEVKG